MTARSYLYVPGDRPEKLAKARTRGADALIVDLEDAVAAADKEAARETVVEWLRDRPADPTEIWVRVNSGSLLADDVRAIASAPGVDGLYLPKVSSPSDLEVLDAMLGDVEMPVVALVETAAGVLDARAIASAPRVARLALGEADLGAELGLDASPDEREWLSMRMHVVLASSAAGIEPPVASVSTDFSDLDAFRTTTDAFRRMGFGARSAIHPAQVAVINEVFTPGPDEVAHAQGLVDAFDAAGRKAFAGPDGKMVDEAIVRSARLVLTRAQGRTRP